MYFYLFDSFLADPKYKKILEEIEGRILDLDIGGRDIHLTVLRDFATSIKTGLDDRYTTIIVVGDDHTLNKAVNVLAGQDKPLGIIPIGDDLEICKNLGLPEEVEAVDVIANRLIEKIDLGKANKNYFIASAEGKGHNFIINGDNQYDIEISPNQNFKIANLACLNDRSANPEDNALETFVYNRKKKFLGKDKITLDSRFANRKLKIKSRGKSAPITLDKKTVLKTPLEIEVIPKAINVIVGRERKF